MCKALNLNITLVREYIDTDKPGIHTREMKRTTQLVLYSKQRKINETYKGKGR